MMARQDILTLRVLDRTATADELGELAELAAEDGSTWARLAGAMAAERCIAEGVQAAGAIAASVELPVMSLHAGHGSRPSACRVVATWTGWAAAAMLAITLMIVRAGTAPPGQNATVVSQPSLALSVDEILQQYVRTGRDEGRVIGQLPSVTVDVKPTADGRATEVIFVRRLLERTTIDQVYRVGHDEHGRARAVPESPAVPPRARSM